MNIRKYEKIIDIRHFIHSYMYNICIFVYVCVYKHVNIEFNKGYTYRNIVKHNW